MLVNSRYFCNNSLKFCIDRRHICRLCMCTKELLVTTFICNSIISVACHLIQHFNHFNRKANLLLSAMLLINIFSATRICI